MELRHEPLLQIQRDLYALPRGRERFEAYIATMTDADTGDMALPLMSMNPMGKDHIPEILDGWTSVGGNPETEISFVPQSAPMVRGIFTTAHIFMKQAVEPAEIRAWYESYYESMPFVDVVEGTPEITRVWGSNRCEVSVAVAGRKIAVCTAIDNLVKGASGAAVQNMNLMLGLPDAQGLAHPGFWL